MHIGLAYADKFKRTWLKLDVPDGCTVREAIEKAGMLTQYPDIDLDSQRVGIFGKFSRDLPPHHRGPGDGAAARSGRR